MPSDQQALRADGVTFAYDGRPVLHDITVSLPEGNMLALAGPNGSGKTTLLRLLAGRLKPSGGTVYLDGRPLSQIAPRERARAISVVPQRMDPRLAFTAEQLVLMGRTPHAGLLAPITAFDRSAVHDALRATDARELAGRRYSELSGGEQQRVAIAMALAQEGRYLLLDEPMVHLDLQHQHDLLELLRRLHDDRGVGILAVMHDLNLAALYFDHLAALSGGHLVAEGKSADLIRQPDVLRLFQAPLAVVEHPTAGVPQVLLERDADR